MRIPTVMIRKHRSLEHALSSLMRDDKEYVIVKHSLRYGEVIDEHYHPRVKEWIIFNHGRFELSVDSARQTIESRTAYRSVEIPARAMHGMKSLSDFSYYVLREDKGKTVWKKDLPEGHIYNFIKT
jgi:quercetin dioxygenase-like cupin family protein